jgi:hypothetical protein
MRARHATLTDVLEARLEPTASPRPGIPGLGLELPEPTLAAGPEVPTAFRRGLAGALLLSFSGDRLLPLGLSDRGGIGSASSSRRTACRSTVAVATARGRRRTISLASSWIRDPSPIHVE